jgi:hypothetical protein
MHHDERPENEPMDSGETASHAIAAFGVDASQCQVLLLILVC